MKHLKATTRLFAILFPVFAVLQLIRDSLGNNAGRPAFAAFVDHLPLSALAALILAVAGLLFAAFFERLGQEIERLKRPPGQGE